MSTTNRDYMAGQWAGRRQRARELHRAMTQYRAWLAYRRGKSEQLERRQRLQALRTFMLREALERELIERCGWIRRADGRLVQGGSATELAVRHRRADLDAVAPVPPRRGRSEQLPATASDMPLAVEPEPVAAEQADPVSGRLMVTLAPTAEPVDDLAVAETAMRVDRFAKREELVHDIEAALATLVPDPDYAILNRSHVEEVMSHLGVQVEISGPNLNITPMGSPAIVIEPPVRLDEVADEQRQKAMAKTYGRRPNGRCDGVEEDQEQDAEDDREQPRDQSSRAAASRTRGR